MSDLLIKDNFTNQVKVSYKIELTNKMINA